MKFNWLTKVASLVGVASASFLFVNPSFAAPSLNLQSENGQLLAQAQGPGTTPLPRTDQNRNEIDSDMNNSKPSSSDRNNSNSTEVDSDVNNNSNQADSVNDVTTPRTDSGDRVPSTNIDNTNNRGEYRPNSTSNSDFNSVDDTADNTQPVRGMW